MKFPRVISAAAFIMSATTLSWSAPASADTQPPISGAMDAVFPFGLPQTFKLSGGTKGKKCTFKYAVTPTAGDVSVSIVQTVSAPLPWTSPDLRLPGSVGPYAVLVQAVDPGQGAAWTCNGYFALSFSVTPETGKLIAIKAGAKVAAVNQTIGFDVSGKNFGVCRYTEGVSRQGTDVGHSTVSQLPYHFNAAFPDAGEYLATADEIDVNGAPSGCSGHVKDAFVVIPRPACPLVREYYQTADDGEFGCLFQAGGAVPIPPYGCPTGYDKFQSSDRNVQYGCRRHSSSALSLAAITPLLGSAANAGAALGPVLTQATPAPQTDQPAIKLVQAVAASGPGHIARPNSNVFYAGENFQVDVSGNIPNTGGFEPTRCGYTVELQNISTGKVTNTISSYIFKIWDVGVVPTPGEYRVRVIPYNTPGGDPQACLGKAEIAKIRFYPQAGWVTGLKLVGFGYHFNMADAAGMDEFCENCTSIFSPAHNRAFLQVIPTVMGTSPSGQCAYSVIFTGGGKNDIASEGDIMNGKPAIPTDQLHFFAQGLTAPWWSMYSNDKQTVRVTIGVGNDAAPGWGPCNVVGGTISKTITFYADPKAGTITK